MPRSLDMLQTLRPVKVPDPTARHRTLADARLGQQTEQMNALKIQGAESELATEQAAQQKALQVNDVLARHQGDIESALPEIMQIDPVFGNAMAKSGADLKNVESQIQTRESEERRQSAKTAWDVIQDKRKADAEAAKPITLPPGTGAMRPGEEQPFYTQPFAPRAEPVPIPGRDIPLPAEVEAQRTRMGAANRVPRVDPAISVSTVDEQGRPITKVLPRSEALGQEFPQAPTAEQRNRETALDKIGPILDGISDLSEKINTGKGLMAKASGAVERAKAQANYNDDIAEYQSLIAGFTPMIARAVGHTGVLTQQDVDSVRELFPKPGDSKTLRDRKVAQIHRLLGAGRNAQSGSGKEQFSPSTGQYRHSLDGGKTWHSGRLPR